jgi:hypothetical protein
MPRTSGGKSAEKLLGVWIDYDSRHDQARSRGHCAIAHRIRESDPDIHRVDVTYESIAFSYHSNRKRMYFNTTPTAKKFILQLDTGKEPEPFMLVLRRSDLIKVYNTISLGRLRPVIEHDGRGSGPRGPRMRSLPVPA